MAELVLRKGRMKGIGKTIKELRNEIGITQNELADVLGVTQDSISLWENDKRIPDTHYIVLLSAFFEVTTDYLLGVSDDLNEKIFAFEGKIQEGLSSEEIHLLDCYRRLSKEEQKNFLSQIEDN